MTKTVTGRVTGVKRHGVTYYGNPIMSVTIEPVALTPGAVHSNGVPWLPSDGPMTFRISDNAGIVYGIENPEYRDIPHTFTVTKAGRLSGMVRPANVAELAALADGWNGVQE